MYDNIFPQIQPSDTPQGFDHFAVIKPLFIHSVGLNIFYIEDTGTTPIPISNERLKELNMSIEELHRIALTNLENFDNTQKGSRVLTHPDGSKAITYGGSQFYNAVRLLLLFNPIKLDYFITILGDPFYVAIPCRDHFFAVPESHENELIPIAQQQFKNNPFPITPNLFLFSKKQETFS